MRALVAVAALVPALAFADVVVPVDSVENFVNVRAEMDSESMIIGRLRQGNSMPHLGSESGWHKVDLDGGASGYTSADWTRVVADSEQTETPVNVASEPEAAVVATAATNTDVETEATESVAEEVAVAVELEDNGDTDRVAAVDQNDVSLNLSQGPPGPPGPPGPQGPPGPPGIGGDGAGLEGDENYLVKFAKPTVGGNSQIFDDGRNVGIGTVEPKQRLEVNGSIQIHEQNSSVAGLMITQSSGDTGYIMHNRASTLTIGAGSVDRITIDRAGNVGFGQTEPNHPIEMGSGAHVTAGGVWTNSSSRAKKENVQTLSPEEALETLASLEPVLFNYKVDRGDQHVGFIAEDVPDLVASRDRKGLSAMDIVAVLTRVVQQQQRQIEELERRLAE